MIAQSSANVAARKRPPGYPAELEQRLGDLTVRPIVPADGSRLRSEFEAADAETLRMRFLASSPRLSHHDFEHLTTIDYTSRLALTAWDGRRPVAIARYEPAGDDTAEVAFVVKPEYRNRGIGRGLIEILARAAATNGYRQLDAIYLAENRAAEASLANAGFVREGIDRGVVTARRKLS